MDIEGQFRGQSCPTMLKYWASLSTRGGVPQYRSFNPMAVANLLPHIYLVEGSGGDIRFRLTGSEIDRIIPKARAGSSPMELIKPVHQEAHDRIFHYLLQTPAIVLMQPHLFYEYNETGAADMLSLPFISDKGLVLLVVLETLSHISFDPPMISHAIRPSDQVWFCGLPEPGCSEALPDSIQDLYKTNGTEVHVQGGYLSG